MFITKEFKFDAAHYLPDYNGKCEELHGHTYKFRVVLEGDVQASGLLIDFALVKEIVEREVLEKLDHKDLNKVLDNPSAENLIMFIWECLEDKFPDHVKLYEVTLFETESSYVTYRSGM